jgi:hypothetical protein
MEICTEFLVRISSVKKLAFVGAIDETHHDEFA